MNQRQIKREAKFRAGLMLHGNLNGWEPDDLVKTLGQDTVDKIADEMVNVANRLMEKGGAAAARKAEQGARLDPARVDRALHKTLECDESTGEDTYCDEVAVFIEAYGEGG